MVPWTYHFKFNERFALFQILVYVHVFVGLRQISKTNVKLDKYAVHVTSYWFCRSVTLNHAQCALYSLGRHL